MDFDQGPSTSGHIQAEFFTLQEGLKVPEDPYSLPKTATPDNLNALINAHFHETDSEWSEVSLDFLLGGILLRSDLKEFIEDHLLSTEQVLRIECVLKEPAPVPDLDLPHDDWVSAVIANNDWIISGCYDNTINVWSIKRGKKVHTIAGAHTGPVKCLSWLNKPHEEVGSSLRFVSGSNDQIVHVWDYDVGENEPRCAQALRGHERSVECVCANGDATRVASGAFDSYLKIWNCESDLESDSAEVIGEKATKKRRTDKNVVTRTPMVTLAEHKEAITGVCWMPHEKAAVASASWDHTIILWDLQLAGPKASLTSSKAFTCVDASPLTSQLLTGSVDRHVRLWDPRSTEGSMVQRTFSSHSGWVVDVAWSRKKEHQFVTASYDRLAKLWDTRSPNAPLYDLEGHDDRLLCCDWTNPEVVVTGGVDCSLKSFRIAE